MEALLMALNKMWRDQGLNCCSLPCEDPECREECNANSGGCLGAEFAELMISEFSTGKVTR